MDTKQCKQCNKEFSKGLGRSNPSWTMAKYCSCECYRTTLKGRSVLSMKGRTSPMKGRIFSEEHRRKLSVSHLGNTSAKKLNSKPRGYDARRTRRFKDLRISLLIKSSYICSECGQIKGRLEIDHIKPVKFYPELVFDEENMRVLCRDCHKKTPTYGIKVFKHKHEYTQ